jgi:hypothetical protein
VSNEVRADFVLVIYMLLSAGNDGSTSLRRVEH